MNDKGTIIILTAKEYRKLMKHLVCTSYITL